MKVEGITLVITDPCYIKGCGGTRYINEDTIYGDWSCMCYKYDKEEAKKKSKEWDKYYFDLFHKYNFSGLGQDEKKKLYNEFKEKKEKFIEENCYGEFCADSGRVAVYDYNSLNDKDKDWIEKHPWCACVIPDYTGEFSYVVEDVDSNSNGTAHIVGDGFYTVQSGF